MALVIAHFTLLTGMPRVPLILPVGDAYESPQNIPPALLSVHLGTHLDTVLNVSSGSIFTIGGIVEHRGKGRIGTYYLDYRGFASMSAQPVRR